MAVTFYPLTVKKIRPETAGCVSVWLDVPKHLQTIFAYKQGQYITLRTSIDGKEVRRTYSLCSSPLSGQWRVAIKEVVNGTFSRYALNTLRAGDTLEALPPNGRFFTELNGVTQAKKYMAFAAGSGITPILSIIETTLQTELNSSFILVYGNRSRSSIIFKEELEALKNRYLSRFTLQYVFSQEKTDFALQQGRIDMAKCSLLFQRVINPTTIDEFFLCGPQEMIFTVKDHLEAQGISPTKIHFELFHAGKTQKPLQQQANALSDENTSTITLKLDGISTSFLLRTDGENILDAALQQGANLPYACKGGVCCTCKARLVRGEVTMDVNYGLEQDEIAAGFILTCQSHPISSEVVVDFDNV